MALPSLPTCDLKYHTHFLSHVEGIEQNLSHYPRDRLKIVTNPNFVGIVTLSSGLIFRKNGGDFDEKP